MGFLVAACGLLVVACMRDLVPQPGIEPGPPALGAWSLTHWTAREVPESFFIYFFNSTFLPKNSSMMPRTFIPPQFKFGVMPKPIIGFHFDT